MQVLQCLVVLVYCSLFIYARTNQSDGNQEEILDKNRIQSHFRKIERFENEKTEMIDFFANPTTQMAFTGMKDCSNGHSRSYYMPEGWKRLYAYNTPMNAEEEKFYQAHPSMEIEYWDEQINEPESEADAVRKKKNTFRYGFRYHIYGNLNTNQLMIVFRASASDREFTANFKPWHQTIRTNTRPDGTQIPIRIRQSFQEIYDMFKSDLITILPCLVYEYYQANQRELPQILYVGHSLGGSIATIAGGDMELRRKLSELKSGLVTAPNMKCNNTVSEFDDAADQTAVNTDDHQLHVGLSSTDSANRTEQGSVGLDPVAHSGRNEASQATKETANTDDQQSLIALSPNDNANSSEETDVNVELVASSDETRVTDTILHTDDNQPLLDVSPDDSANPSEEMEKKNDLIARPNEDITVSALKPLPPPIVIAFASSGCGNKAYADDYPRDVRIYRIVNRWDSVLRAMKLIMDTDVNHPGVRVYDIGKYDGFAFRKLFTIYTHRLYHYLHLINRILGEAGIHWKT